MLQAILRFCSLEETLVVDAMAALARRRASRMDAEERTKVRLLRLFILQFDSISPNTTAPLYHLFLLPLFLLLLLLILFLPSQQGGWGVLNDRLLEDPPGTFDGVPGYVITRIEEVLLNTTAACHALFTDIIRLTIEY